MKIQFLLCILGLLFISYTASAQEPATKRYFIRSQSDSLKTELGIKHNFEQGFTADLSPDQLRELRGRNFSVEEVATYQILARPSTTVRSCTPPERTPSGVHMVNGGTGGAGVTIAILDTGVYSKHVDLNISRCKDTTGKGVANGCADNQGHGTHVAGIIAANGGSDNKGIYGVAPDATLWAIKVCKTNICLADDIAEGITYAAKQGADIINLSFGQNIEDPLVKNAIDFAYDKGVLIVAAAGNDGPEAGSIDYPAANPKVIAVGSIDTKEQVSATSSRGINDGDYSIEEQEVELGALGVDVYSTTKDGCYATMSGTSMAAPHISGLAAILWQGSGEATRTYLQGLAKQNDLYPLGDDGGTGFGLPVGPWCTGGTYGKVFDASNGVPLSDVIVWVSYAGTPDTYTSFDGRYCVKNLQGTQPTIIAFIVHYKPIFQEYTGHGRYDFYLSKHSDPTDGAYLFVGDLVDKINPTTKLLTGTMTLQGPTTLSRQLTKLGETELRYFFFDEVPLGRYDVKIDSPGYKTKFFSTEDLGVADYIPNSVWGFLSTWGGTYLEPLPE